MKTILITGANGFVCSNIIDVLLARGWFIYAVDRSFDNPAVKSWPADQVKLLQQDVESLPALAVDALLHGAAVTVGPAQRGETPEDNFMANLNPALAMLHYARENAVKRAIFVSSSAVYRASARGSLTEDHVSSPLGMYPIAKHTIEGLVETLRHEYGRDAICIRLGNLYGPHEYTRETRPNTSLVQTLINQGMTGEIRVNERLAAREWTFAPDVGAAVDALLNAETLTYPLYHVAAGQVHSTQGIAEAIQSALADQSVSIVTEDAQTVQPLTRLGTLDAARLAADTGFNAWTPLESGIRQTLQATTQEADHA